MTTSTFCFVKAGIGAVLSISGIGWASSFDQWQGRVWFLLVIATASFAIAGLILRSTERELAALSLGLDLRHIMDAAKEERQAADRPGVLRLDRRRADRPRQRDDDDSELTRH